MFVCVLFLVVRLLGPL
ncbi:hypothetical protein H040_04708 [Pseudomonas sp. URMO17WK12:I7]|nr:hypothetical protein H040_04708 [Pseudomonas sp. URMO17WK12:I7]